jgi:hypothetical protein
MRVEAGTDVYLTPEPDRIHRFDASGKAVHS